MSFSNKIHQEKPWAILGWTRKQWKARRLWKQAGVTEEKMSHLLQALDHSTIQEMKDYSRAELLTESIFGSKDWPESLPPFLYILEIAKSRQHNFDGFEFWYSCPVGLSLVELLFSSWKHLLSPVNLLLVGD